ncbi:hypothetical protein ACS0TY_018629 [Phlomoides rotata]
MATCIRPVFRRTLLLSPPSPPFFCCFSSFSTSVNQSKFKPSFIRCSSPPMEESVSSTLIESEIPKRGRYSSWKPMCLYYTQEKCTKMDDSLHLEMFRHSCSVEHCEGVSVSKNLRPQEFDYFLVLDLEGKVEILEFPVLLFDAKTMQVVDVFHSVWHDTAIKFEEVIEQFESWLRKDRDGIIKLWREEGDGRLNKAAFITCGNWDLKTKVPQQCEVSGIKLPPYFMEWINLKDIYLNFYNRRAPGMLSMMRELRIKALGSHHLGIDDSNNIARVLHHMLSDGALLQLTAQREGASPNTVRFLFQNRIK